MELHFTTDVTLSIKSAPTALGRKNQTWAAFVIGHFWLTKHTASPHFDPSRGLPPMCEVFTYGCSFQNKILFSWHASRLLSLATCSLNLQPAVCCKAPPTTVHLFFLAMWSTSSFLSLKSQLITYLPKYIIINRFAEFSLLKRWGIDVRKRW